MRIAIIALALALGLMAAAPVARAQTEYGVLERGFTCFWGYWTGDFWGDGTFVVDHVMDSCPGLQN